MYKQFVGTENRVGLA